MGVEIKLIIEITTDEQGWKEVWKGTTLAEVINLFVASPNSLMKDPLFELRHEGGGGLYYRLCRLATPEDKSWL